MPMTPTTSASVGTRKTLDCRTMPDNKTCTLSLSGTEEEVMTVGIRHAVQEHKMKDTPELRKQIRSMLKEQSS